MKNPIKSTFFISLLLLFVYGCGAGDRETREQRKKNAAERVSAALEKGPIISRYAVDGAEVVTMYIPSREPRSDTLDYSFCIIFRDAKENISSMHCRESF